MLFRELQNRRRKHSIGVGSFKHKSVAVKRKHSNSASTSQRPKLLKSGEHVLDTKRFALPATVTGSARNVRLGKALIKAWQSDGIFLVMMDPSECQLEKKAMEADRAFVQLSDEEKKRFVSELSYSGYIGTKEEETAGEPDAAEIFTVTKDISSDDARVKAGWPCHGPVCWPNEQYKRDITAFMDMLGRKGEKLLMLAALGLGLPIDTFTKLTADGWHHMRVLHFPTRAQSATERGIGSHTDYGTLVLATQDQVGGLFVRRPSDNEWRPRNWLPNESAAGLYEQDQDWWFVPPKSGCLTCFPGDMLQFLTGGKLLSTPHKVRLSSEERFALAYFHEPNFNAVLRPLNMFGSDDECETIHYGTHFTNMFMRCYPDRITTRRLIESEGLEMLDKLRAAAELLH